MVMKIADGRANDAGQVESEEPTTRHDQGESDPSFNTSGPSEGGFLHRLHLTRVHSASLFFRSIDSTSARFSDRVGNTLYLTIAYAAATPSFQLIFFPWS